MDETANNEVENLYTLLAEFETKIQDSVQDPRYGKDESFTKEVNSLRLKKEVLRKNLAANADKFLSSDLQTFRGLLEEMGISSDNLLDIKEYGQIAATASSIIESAVKVAHPALWITGL